MRSVGYLLFALAIGTVASGPASAANMCRAEQLTCATTMPIGGYCECTSAGTTKGGTVVDASNQRGNSTAGGCGAQPNSPGCRP